MNNFLNGFDNGIGRGKACEIGPLFVKKFQFSLGIPHENNFWKGQGQFLNFLLGLSILAFGLDLRSDFVGESGNPHDFSVAVIKRTENEVIKTGVYLYVSFYK